MTVSELRKKLKNIEGHLEINILIDGLGYPIKKITDWEFFNHVVILLEADLDER